MWKSLVTFTVIWPMMVHFNLPYLHFLKSKTKSSELPNMIHFHRCMPVPLVLTTLFLLIHPSVRMRGLTATIRKTCCSSGAWPDWRKRKWHRKIAVEVRERKRQRKNKSKIGGKMQGMVPSYKPKSFLPLREFLHHILPVWALHWKMNILNVLNINVMDEH